MKWKWDGFSSSTLKMIAIISMLIDHFGFAVYAYLPNGNAKTLAMLRLIGRIAFPIYCFLLVEGFFYTKNVKKYIGRMFLFAMISEVPFNMVCSGKFFDYNMQNVFFTLTLGLIVLCFLERCKGYDTISLTKQFLVIIIGAVLSQYGEFDYHYVGILFIVMFYYLRDKNPWLRDIVGALAFSYEKTAPLAFIPIHLYNGKRGLKLKYFFYWIYPVHLLIFGYIKMFILMR